ncbi:hypothetical protein CKM354_000050200 [Cercospora kikuchii]|uniref:RING-type domain-containing protein n=1 Tax=Cercospora kikuchii TaxID=84275 RepID=A0A9P3C5Y2_9PEZI|nr:uncharacterized protein CKM354_000050200 [Cercospora kikuchii]GIZ37039.1 hypothetical protein CKM354_000050200 [Cercospora kikuchii]
MSTWGFEALDDWEGDFGEAVEEPDGSQMRESHHDGNEHVAPTAYSHDTPPPLPRSAPTLSSAPARHSLRHDHFFPDASREQTEQLEPLPYLQFERAPLPAFNLDQDEPPAGPTEASTPTSLDSHEFVTLEDTESEDDDEEVMARRLRARRSSVVDLTETSPPAPACQTKRKRSTDATASGSDGRAKRRRASGGEIEEIDLANEAPSAEEELLQAQQQEAIRAQQQASDDSMPQKIGRRQCIICLENFTNCTATACGHFFCHECLHQALVAAARTNDRGHGSCPVCRKNLSHKKKADMIPISFMTKKHYDTHYKDKQKA